MSETNSDKPASEHSAEPKMSYDLEPAEPAPAPPPPPPPPDPVKVVEEPVHPIDAFIKPGFGSAQVIGIAGATTLSIAAVFAAVHGGRTGWWSSGLLTVYLGLLHAGTGAAATGFVGYALGRSIGDVPLAAARMLLSVGLLLLTLHSGLPLHPLLLYLCALAVYAIATIILFRWEISEWAGVVSIHAILWFLMHLAAILQFKVWSTPTPVPAT
ncbi:MAG: hypothetical protein JSS51_14270 [Planctomycetes bacterium]|nr:hypothetical protein [Planctomycetota bacterium]